MFTLENLINHCWLIKFLSVIFNMHPNLQLRELHIVNIVNYFRLYIESTTASTLWPKGALHLVCS